MTPANKKCEDLYSLLDDLCDGTISVADAARLDVLLQSDPSARREYLSYLEVHAGLGLISGKRLNTPSPLSYPSFDLLSPSPFPLPHPFIGGPVFSYMAASVIVCLMLLGAWAYKISHHRDLGVVAGSLGSTTSGPSDQPELVFVGRITGMKDCHWADADTQTIVGASVPLGRKYALSSGLMEITYQSGARVILEGPCTYKLESSAGGFLERGKLTANVRTQNSKLKTQSAEPSLLSSLSSPLFSVRTPTAVVTDLGTEFGVEVAENGDTTSHVFQGSVKVQATNLPSPASGKGAGGEGGTILLAVGESVTVKKDEAETLR
ncbi:MAG: FecR domain-containing protein, partial [Pirellulales bacterium]|nr:FecR domain-containing protein [Pirellulales bacterium]